MNIEMGYLPLLPCSMASATWQMQEQVPLWTGEPVCNGMMMLQVMTMLQYCARNMAMQVQCTKRKQNVRHAAIKEKYSSLSGKMLQKYLSHLATIK